MLYLVEGLDGYTKNESVHKGKCWVYKEEVILVESDCSGLDSFE